MKARLNECLHIFFGYKCAFRCANYSQVFALDPCSCWYRDPGRITAQAFAVTLNAVLEALTLSALHTKLGTFANNAEPDVTANNEPSHQDLHCLPFCFEF